MNAKEQLHQIKVNIPASEDDYKNGNGEGCWAEVDSKTYSDYLRDERGGQYVGKLLNQPFTDLHGLQYGDYFVFEMRGKTRRHDGSRHASYYQVDNQQTIGGQDNEKVCLAGGLHRASV